MKNPNNGNLVWGDMAAYPVFVDFECPVRAVIVQSIFVNGERLSG